MVFQGIAAGRGTGYSYQRHHHWAVFTSGDLGNCLAQERLGAVGLVLGVALQLLVTAAVPR